MHSFSNINASYYIKMPACSICQKPCKGNRCRGCYEGKRTGIKPSNEFNLQDIISPLDVSLLDLNSSTNADRLLFSNPSFTDGLLSDIQYVLAADDSARDGTLGESDTKSAETFSLIKLITGIVKKEISPLQKELDEVKATNKILEEEIKVMKMERDAAADGDGSINSTGMNLDSVLAPYKEALDKLAPMEQSLENHQRYLDRDDAKKREKNVIITGVKEIQTDDNVESTGESETEENVESTGESETEDTDLAAVKCILLAAGCDVAPVQVKRLGKPNKEENRHRPILVVTDSVESRRKILQKKSALKNLGDERFKSVYIKPDEPLAIRREWQRLRLRMKKEKEAPTNQGAEIKLDYKTRKLTRDGTVIDQFEAPFTKRGPNH